MRILVIHTYYKLQGGEDAVVQNEIELLKGEGHEVELLAFDNAKATLINVLFMPFNLVSYIKALKKIKSFKPAIIHIHNLHFAGNASILYAAKKMKVPIVMTIHNYRLLCPSGSLFFDNKLFLESLKETFPWSAVQKGVYQQSKAITFWLAFSNFFNRKIGTWKLIDSMIFLGQHSEEIFQQSGLLSENTKTFLKPNFTNQKIMGPKNDCDNYYLFIGRLSEEKGIRTLVKAFLNYPGELKIAGSGPLQDFVLGACAQYRNIKYLGQLSKTEIESALAGAKALIFPSEWYETFGMVIIEAFSLGKPVIASNLGNISSIVKDQINGISFSPGDVNELRQKLFKFDNMNDQEKKELAMGALKTYDTYYAPEANLKLLIHIYNDTIAGKKRNGNHQ